MTPAQSILSSPSHAVPAALRKPVRLCWVSHSCLRGHGLRRLVMEIEPQTTNEAMVEAWVENGSRAMDRRTVLSRQTLRMECCVRDSLLHLDVYGDNGNGRIAAISLALNVEAGSVRPLYAHTSLLQAAGFSPGSYDSPTAIEMSDPPVSDRKRSG